MIELRKSIKDLLDTTCSIVYHMRATETKGYPYLVYNLTSVFYEGEGVATVSLEVDGWDKDFDTLRMETLMSNVRIVLDKAAINKDDFSIVFYLDNSLHIGDPEPDIQRIQHTYTGKLIERRQ